MRIAQLAPLWKPVPPPGYGGSELVVSLLADSLAEEGAEVTVFACGGSATKGKLVEVIEKPMYDLIGGRFDFTSIQPYEFLAYHEVLQRARSGEFDIIHNHMGFHVAALAEAFGVPVVTTTHSSLPPDFEYLARVAKDSNYVSISDAQRQITPYLNYVDTVYHGIDTDTFKFNPEPEDFILFLASLTKNKGIDRALDIAEKSGLRLVVAGEIRDPDEFAPFKERMDKLGIDFLGEADEDQKRDLMRRAKAYLFPIRWNEAFGLTVVEALASGTPVVAWPNGSLPELIDNGKTGFLVDSVDEAVEALKKIDQIDRQGCRDESVRRFDRRVMAANYLKVYERLAR